MRKKKPEIITTLGGFELPARVAFDSIVLPRPILWVTATCTEYEDAVAGPMVAGTIRIIQEVTDDRGACMKVYADENGTILAATARGCTHALPILPPPPPPGETIAAKEYEKQIRVGRLVAELAAAGIVCEVNRND